MSQESPAPLLFADLGLSEPVMKAVAAAMDALSQEQIAELEKSGLITLDIEGQQISVEAVDVDIISEDIPGWLVSNEGNLTVALEVELNDELRNEGMARELAFTGRNFSAQEALAELSAAQPDAISPKRRRKVG